MDLSLLFKILVPVIFIIVLLLIKNSKAKNESYKEDMNLKIWENARNNNGNLNNEGLFKDASTKGQTEETNQNKIFNEAEQNKEFTENFSDEPCEDCLNNQENIKVNESKDTPCDESDDSDKAFKNFVISNSETEDLQKTDTPVSNPEEYPLNLDEEENNLRKRRKKNHKDEERFKDINSEKTPDVQNPPTEDTPENLCDAELVCDKCEPENSQVKVSEKIEEAPKKELKLIKEVDDFIANIDNLDTLKNAVPKSCLREDYDTGLDFHKSITSGGMDSFKKDELDISENDYNLFDVIDFMKNSAIEPIKISRKKFLTLQYNSTDKDDIDMILSNNKLKGAEEEEGLLDGQSSINSTITINKENNTISEVTDCINYNKSKRTIFTKKY